MFDSSFEKQTKSYPHKDFTCPEFPVLEKSND
jgi:hypothetical protein